jgi:prolyl oligopeptidase
VLRAYSPFHNVHAGAKYPPFLVTISTEDNRVGPGHARKFAAKLAQVGAPVYFLEYDEGGHGLSAGFARPDLQAMRIAFLVDALGVATAQ